MDSSIKKHTVVMRERGRLDVTAVADIDSFDDTSVILMTSEGELSIEGSELHIERFDSVSGDIALTGRIDALIYSSVQPADEKKSALKKLLR